MSIIYIEVLCVYNLMEGHTCDQNFCTGFLFGGFLSTEEESQEVMTISEKLAKICST